MIREMMDFQKHIILQNSEIMIKINIRKKKKGRIIGIN
jgi:hypothetical protein